MHGGNLALELGQIRLDGGTQPRVKIEDSLVEEYMEILNEMPAVVAYYDGQSYWLADGFHRLAAAKRLGWPDIQVSVTPGTLRDAQLYSFSANATHGARRTNEDKRLAVTRMLADDEWKAWSDHEIARRCAVTRPFVGSLRQQKPPERVFTHPKTGTKTIMHVSNIGHSTMTHAAPKPGGKSSKVSFGSSSRHEIRLRLRGDDYEALERIARGNMQHVEEAALDILVKGIKDDQDSAG